MNWTQIDDAVLVTLSNGVRLDFALVGGALRGLVQVTVNELPLIAPDCPRLPYVETRDGWAVSSYRLTGVKQEGNSIILEAEVLGTKSGMGIRQDMYQFPYIHTPHRSPGVLGTFRWHMKPETITVGHPGLRENTYCGFSYRYEFALTHPFHWILDSGTWELGGDPEGVTIFSQHMAAIGGPLEQTLSRQGKGYTSAETFAKGSSNNADVFHDYANDPNDEYILPIQSQLRGAGGALIDTQFRSDSQNAGMLFCCYLEPGYYKTLLEWRPENAGVGHLDHLYFPKTTQHVTPAKFILAAPVQNLSRTAALNRWTDMNDFVSDAWREQAGISKLNPVPGFGLDNCGVGGEHIGYGPADLFDRWEARFGWLQENGYKTFFLTSFVNHAGHGQPYVANACTPFDYHVHPRYGGAERFRQFCDSAHAHGIKVVTWIGVPAQSAPIIKEHPDWMIRYENGAPWDGNYGTLVSGSLRRGFREWLLSELRYLRDLGLDAIFIDSYHNLWALPINYSQPDLVPQFSDLISLQAEIERMGLDMWVETFSPLGLTSAGFWPEYGKTPELNCGTHYRILADNTRSNDFTNGSLPPAVYFRMLANKAPVGIAVVDLDDLTFEGPIDAHVPPEIGRMNHVYNALLPAMTVRTLHGDNSVEWVNPKTGERALFGVTGSVTVPLGFRAEPIYGADISLDAGQHKVAELTAFRLSAV